MNLPPAVVPPPPGPGVEPPYPAPPTEGRNFRVGLGVGLGAAVLVLGCGGGFAALVGIAALTTSAFNEQAEVIIGDYLTNIRDKRWDAAYESLCPSEKSLVSKSEFTTEAQSATPITSWRVGEADLTDPQLVVPVDLTYADGRTGKARAHLEQNTRTAKFQVCSVEE